jgi:nucleoside-diphosphate-sugar epimerase
MSALHPKIPPAAAPVILTGATGFLGAHLLASLLGDGRAVIVLGRSKDHDALADRLGRLLAWFGLDPRGCRLEAIETDFQRPDCGLSAVQRARIAAAGGDFIHCASETSFIESRRAEIFAANVGGLKNLLALATMRGAGWFHFVSTAYAVGLCEGLAPEAPITANRFVNAYEASKAEAEHLVAAQCGAAGVPFTLMRPSIVYGDARTGRALKFTALYRLVQALCRLKEVMGREVRHGTARDRAVGAHADAVGSVHLPLRLHLPAEGLINLVPVDYFVAAARAILAAPTPGGIYHLTSDHPPALGTLAGYCERFLGVHGFELSYGWPPPAGLRAPHELLFARFTEPYHPYLADQRRFATSNARRATGGLVPPEFDYTLFARCMAYAVSVGWGERLFPA